MKSFTQKCILKCNHQHQFGKLGRCQKFLSLTLDKRWDIIIKYGICPICLNSECSYSCSWKILYCKLCLNVNHHYHLCGKYPNVAERTRLRFLKENLKKEKVKKISKTRKPKLEPESNHSSDSWSPPLCQQSVYRKLAPIQKGVNEDRTNASGPDHGPDLTNLDPSLTTIESISTMNAEPDMDLELDDDVYFCLHLDESKEGSFSMETTSHKQLFNFDSIEQNSNFEEEDDLPDIHKLSIPAKSKFVVSGPILSLLHDQWGADQTKNTYTYEYIMDTIYSYNNQYKIAIAYGQSDPNIDWKCIKKKIHKNLVPANFEETPPHPSLGGLSYVPYLLPKNIPYFPSSPPSNERTIKKFLKLDPT